METWSLADDVDDSDASSSDDSESERRLAVATADGCLFILSFFLAPPTSALPGSSAMTDHISRDEVTTLLCCKNCVEQYGSTQNLRQIFSDHDFHEPKVLDCGHTLCLACVREIFQCQPVFASKLVPCPECKKDAKLKLKLDPLMHIRCNHALLGECVSGYQEKRKWMP